MVLSQNFLVIPIGQADPREYLQNLIESYHQLFSLIFSYRELDLTERELFALYMANGFMERITNILNT